MTVEALSGVVPDEREARYLRMLAEHGPAVRRLARTYELDLARREDLVQDICLALWQALRTYRGECSERTFVFRVGHNRGITHAMRFRRRPADALDEAAEVPDSAAGPEDAAAGRQRHERLHLAVQSLPIALRQVISLTLEGLTARETADVLGISDNAVGVRLTRARRILREQLNPAGDPT